MWSNSARLESRPSTIALSRGLPKFWCHDPHMAPACFTKLRARASVIQPPPVDYINIIYYDDRCPGHVILKEPNRNCLLLQMMIVQAMLLTLNKHPPSSTLNQHSLAQTPKLSKLSISLTKLPLLLLRLLYLITPPLHHSHWSMQISQ